MSLRGRRIVTFCITPCKSISTLDASFGARLRSKCQAALSPLKQTAATNDMQEVDILRTLTVKKLNLVALGAYSAGMSCIHSVEIAAQDLLLAEERRSANTS